MKYLLILLFLLPVSSAWALEECRGSPNKGDDLNKIKHWDNCEGTQSFTAGDKYIGEWKDGLPHGHGTYAYPSGNKYVGEFKNGLFHGQGTYYYLADNEFKGDIYVGEQKDGKAHGQGTYTWADGEKYVGEWKDEKRHGQGTLTGADGKILKDGQWTNGKYVGKSEYEDEVIKLEEVEELYKNKVITDEERKKMRNKILGID